MFQRLGHSYHDFAVSLPDGIYLSPNSTLLDFHVEIQGQITLVPEPLSFRLVESGRPLKLDQFPVQLQSGVTP